MNARFLGRTGIAVPVIAFGAGPVSGLMTGDDFELQCATVARALAAGITWFDTAAGYGDGRSERNLGRVLTALDAWDRVQIATKVRVPADSVCELNDHIRRSLESSCERLGTARVTLLQLHNGITPRRGDEPASVSVEDILGPNGIAATMQGLRNEGLIQAIGLTGTGHPDALRSVIRAGTFDTLQVPYNALNPSAGQPQPIDGETEYGNVLQDCWNQNMGAFAIRVFAGGALLDREPSAHTRTTPYFPLTLYERDRKRSNLFPDSNSLNRVRFGIEFALSHPAVTAAIIGFGSPEHVDEATAWMTNLPAGSNETARPTPRE